MTNLTHSYLGLAHLIFALAATLTGTLVLIMRKGTKRHKRWGYVYAVSMFGVNGTALMIYRLFGGFGIFHYGAVFSLLTLLGGMIPAIRRTKPSWIYRHFAFMYWSVIGLYAAFASETLVRVPNSPFFGMVALASGLIFLLGALGHGPLRKKWLKRS